MAGGDVVERGGPGVRPRIAACGSVRGEVPAGTDTSPGARSTVRARRVAPSGDGGGVAVPRGSVAGRVAEVREWLIGVDGAELSDRERVDLIAELERLKGSASAAQARATDELRRSRQEAVPQDAVRSLGSEVALARRESPARGDRFVGLSRALVREMPWTMRALTEGVVGERHAVAVVQATAALSLDDRAEVDRRVGPLLGRLGVGAAARAAAKVAAELDAASVVRRMEEAVRSRRVTVRPAPDGMAYLTVLAPLQDAVGAFAALRARAASVVGGQCAGEAPDGRGLGAVMSDTATRLMSGRAEGQVQPLEVHLVMTDTALFGPAVSGARGGSAVGAADGAQVGGSAAGGAASGVMEPARIPGHGSVPAPVARQWIRDAGDASVWLRRLYTSPDGRDLVAMDSRRRVFTGHLRRMLVLRDDRCTTPWCDGLVAHADHATPAREGSVTDFATGNGKCARCNYVKEAPGWRTRVVGARSPDQPDPAASAAAESPPPHELEVTTPLGRRYRSVAPPLLGWGWQPRPSADSHSAAVPSLPRSEASPVAQLVAPSRGTFALPTTSTPPGGARARRAASGPVDAKVNPLTAPDVGATDQVVTPVTATTTTVRRMPSAATPGGAPGDRLKDDAEDRALDTSTQAFVPLRTSDGPRQGGARPPHGAGGAHARLRSRAPPGRPPR